MVAADVGSAVGALGVQTGRSHCHFQQPFRFTTGATRQGNDAKLLCTATGSSDHYAAWQLCMLSSASGSWAAWRITSGLNDHACCTRMRSCLVHQGLRATPHGLLDTIEHGCCLSVIDVEGLVLAVCSSQQPWLAACGSPSATGALHPARHLPSCLLHHFIGFQR